VIWIFSVKILGWPSEPHWKCYQTCQCDEKKNIVICNSWSNISYICHARNIFFFYSSDQWWKTFDAFLCVTKIFL